MSGCECKPDAKRKRDSAQPEANGAAIKKMKNLTIFLLTVTALLAAAAPLAAHHSFAAEFDGTKRIQLTGVVTKVEWTNPHVWFYVNVKDEATGKIVNWGAEMGSPNALNRTGWTRNTMQVGMV